MIIPKDVVCNFCKRIFCCSACRLKHEEKTHVIELKEIEHQEDIKKGCVICNGEEFPLKLDGLSKEVFQHILDTHLPLKCNKCTKVFEGQADFVDFDKCATPNQNCCLNTANVEVEKEKKSTFKVPGKVADDERSLTPLSKINLRWRRKSKGFEPSAILDSASVSESHEDKTKSPKKNLVRQTSTPMPNNMPSRSISSYTDSSLSIHISSINYTSGTSSSDSDSCISPPVQQLKEQVKITPKSPTVPKRGNNIQNRNRPKLPVQATPLRQVMSKSIQKALAQHGFTKQINYSGLQQRKVCFDSTGSDSSGGDTTGNTTSSFRPLDLRTTPVLRRTQSDSSGSRLWRMQQEKLEVQSIHQMKDKTDEGDDKENHSQSEMKDNSDIYYSCPSLALIDPPENLIEETPKIVNANVGLLKKAISFETPLNNEEFSVGPPSLSSEDDDVFYTPCATPQRSYSCSEIDFQLKKSEIKELAENVENKKSDGTFWNLVSSVVAVASKKSEKPAEVKSQSKFNFAKGALVQKAASFAGFLRSLRGSDDDAQVHSPLAKRRRTAVNDLSTIQSPLKKRQKIQGRKPIERMRNSS